MTSSSCPVTRRQFGKWLGALPLALHLKADQFASMPWNEPATVARVFLAGEMSHWPKVGLDVRAEVSEIEGRLREVQSLNARHARFVGGEILRGEAEVKPWLAKYGNADGVLMIPLMQPTPPLRALVDGLCVPALFFSRPYATHAWSSIAAYQKAGKKIDVVATSSYGDLDPYMRAFRTASHLRKSRVIVGAAPPGARQSITDAYGSWFGTSFRFFTGREFEEAFRAVNEGEAKREADEFVKGALRVVEPSAREIEDGLRFYLAVQNIMKREKANAVTIDCFGSLAANTLPGYPCIAWSKLNDVGLYGVCEADIHSTMSQMLVTSYARVPGFVSDPVFDVSRNEVIHAHCVAATRMAGIDEPPAPYIIRNHLETAEGAVVQVLMPSGRTITVGRFNGPKDFMVSTAEVTGAVDSDRGCRSQIRTRVPDAGKWLRAYGGGLHRVIFYGDHVRDIERMGRLMGFTVRREV